MYASSGGIEASPRPVTVIPLFICSFLRINVGGQRGR
jgi:hypothetical protein